MEVGVVFITETLWDHCRRDCLHAATNCCAIDIGNNGFRTMCMWCCVGLCPKVLLVKLSTSSVFSCMTFCLFLMFFSQPFDCSTLVMFPALTDKSTLVYDFRVEVISTSVCDFCSWILMIKLHLFSWVFHAIEFRAWFMMLRISLVVAVSHSNLAETADLDLDLKPRGLKR